MRRKSELQDYESVTPSGRRRHSSWTETENGSASIRAVKPILNPQQPARLNGESRRFIQTPKETLTGAVLPDSPLKPGHSLSYLGLFLFTFLVYFRPYEIFPALSWLSRSALVVAILTLVVFIPTQLGLENHLTVWTREVKLVLALVLTGLLSIPLALEPSTAFKSLVELLKVAMMFVVMVNAVRTEKRLRGLILLVLFVSCVLSVAAVNDYARGNLALEGRRIAGFIGGLFSNPNDLALHLVTMIPLSLALFFSSRGLKRAAYIACSLLLMAGLVATFSRGGFLGFTCVIGFLAWKLARRNRLIFGGAALVLLLAAVTLAPSSYRSRLATANDDSATARTDDLKRSILVAARHPLFGVGMDNYVLYSNMNKATHNAYTQVAAEMGFSAFLIYLWFLLSPFKQLRRLEEAFRKNKRRPPVYYLAIGLQASLVGYMVVSFFASVAYLWYVYYLVAYCVCLRRIYAGVVGDDESPANVQQVPAGIPATRQSATANLVGAKN